MGYRYSNRNLIRSVSKRLGQILSRRNKKWVVHYDTPEFSYPSEESIGNFNLVYHIWSDGDKYYKLAHENYGDSNMWWVIALYNNKPTEHHVNLGDVIYIPHPIDQVLDSLGV